SALLPFKGSLLPLVNEPDGEDAQEGHHRPESEHPDGAERYSPGEQKRNFEVEYDEEDGDQIEPDVESTASVGECFEAALVGRQLLRIRLLAGEYQGCLDRGGRDPHGHGGEDQHS